MADISKIRLGDQSGTYTEYNIKDATARQATNEIEQDIILGGVYDVSAKNSGATFASLSALLSNANLSTLIPTAVRKGGMSIRFITTSDNKYVEYMYSGTATDGTPNPFLDTANWEKVNLEDEVSVINKELDGDNPSKSYTVTQGSAINTATANINNRLPVDIKNGEEFELMFEYPQGNNTQNITIYLYNGSSYTPGGNIINGVKKTFIAPTNLDAIALNLSAAGASADGTLTIVAYVKKGIEERVAETEEGINAINSVLPKKVDGRASTNLFDKDAVTTGYYLVPTTGKLVANSSYSVSNYIPVTAGQQYIFTSLSNSAYFDKNKNWLAQAGASNPNTAPSGAAYIRLSISNAGLASFQMNSGATLLPYEPYRSFLTPSSFDEETIEFLKGEYGIDYLDKVRKHLDNPFIRTQIKLIGDSITAGQGGTGYSATGETISGRIKANVLTATCWSNMLYHYIDTVYNRDTNVELINDGVVRGRDVSLSRISMVIDGITVYSYMFLSNNSTEGSNILSFRFYGDHFSAYIDKNNNRGIFALYVDGVFHSNIDTYASSLERLSLVNITGLSDGYHDIAFVTTHTKNESSSGYYVGITGLVIPKTAIIKPWGISGVTSSQPIDMDSVLSADDDFVMLQYGTNDRHIFISPEETYKNLVDAGNKIIETYGAVPIFMCASPCAASYETAYTTTRYFHMWDVHDAICKVGEYFHCPIIDNYTAFQDYAEQHEINTDALLADGLHPNDLGYKVMFMNIMKELGLARLPYYLEWIGETT